MQAEVKRMLDNPGIYIIGDSQQPEVCVIVVSNGTTLRVFEPAQELSPFRFYDTMIIKHGPLK